jgi:hypothetical protein
MRAARLSGMHVVPTKTDELRSAVADAAADHARLLSVVRGVEQLVESSVYPPSGDVARKLYDLAMQFSDHVQHEERSALYTWIPQRFANLRDEVERERRQHAPLVASLHGLAEEAEHALDVRLPTELSVRIRAAIARLRAHEANESSLLQRAARQVS